MLEMFVWPKTPSKVGQITKKSSQPRTETILHTELKFQFDCACYEGEDSTNFGDKVK